MREVRISEGQVEEEAAISLVSDRISLTSQSVKSGSWKLGLVSASVDSSRVFVVLSNASPGLSSVHCLLAVLGDAESSEGDVDTRLRPSSDKRDLFCSCENVAHGEAAT